MNNIYLYPNNTEANAISQNPYINDLKNSLNNHFNVVNQKKSKIGIFNILNYITKIDFIYLNWIEELQFRKFGVLQAIFFLFLIPIFKIFKIKIIWTIHNKKAHIINTSQINNFLIKIMMKHSDFIISHSKDGANYINLFNNREISNIKVFPHPVKKNDILRNDNLKKNDILIWGSIIEYKGILEFIIEFNKRKELADRKVKIIGKIVDINYKKKLLDNITPKIELIDEFIENEDLINQIISSKHIIFPYKVESVLSSGSLAFSIPFFVNIIGPNIGSFKDLEEDELITTYNDFDHLFEIINNDQSRINIALLQNYLDENSWDKFSENLFNWIIKK